MVPHGEAAGYPTGVSFPIPLPGQSILSQTPEAPRAEPAAGRPMSLDELRRLVAERRAVELLSDDELQSLLATSREALVTLAREDINVFAALVLRDEYTGKRVQQAPIHRAMHAFLDARDAKGQLRHPRAVIWGHVEAGKTWGVVIARVLWELGHNPRLRIAVFSKTAGSSGKIVHSIAQYIEFSEDLHMVFPNLRPGPVWRAGEFKVAGASDSKDPSVWAGGVSSQILGARVDWFIGDDIIDLDSTRTPYLRQQTIDWYFGQVEGRLSAVSRVTIIGNAWHPEDVMHRLAEMPGWSARRFPVYDERTGALSWPTRWPRERIEAKRNGMPPTEFARAFLCLARADEDARFPRPALEAAMTRGRGLVLSGGIATWRPGMSLPERRACRFYTGVDLAVSQSKRADFSAIFTLAVWPDGTREPVDIQVGRWQAAEILNRIVRVRAAWGSMFAIENVAAQEWMRQFAALAGVPTRAYSTGTSQPTLHFQAEQLAAEIASHRWVIPTLADGTLESEVRSWVDSMLFYAPNRHVPDVLAASLMAMWLAGSADAKAVATEGSTAVLQRVARMATETRLGCWG